MSQWHRIMYRYCSLRSQQQSTRHFSLSKKIFTAKRTVQNLLILYAVLFCFQLDILYIKCNMKIISFLIHIILSLSLIIRNTFRLRCA